MPLRPLFCSLLFFFTPHRTLFSSTLLFYPSTSSSSFPPFCLSTSLSADRFLHPLLHISSLSPLTVYTLPLQHNQNMSHPTLRSALTKRKADGDSLTEGREKKKIQFTVKDDFTPTFPLPRRRTLLRSKTLSIRTSKEDDNFFDKVNFDPTVFIPLWKQGPTNAIQSHHESGPNNLPLNSSSNGQEGAIFNESSTTNNDRVALLPQDQVTDLSTSSDFSRRRAKNDIDIVGDDKQPDPTVEANQQHIHIIGDDQQPSETVETDHQPDNTAEVNQQPYYAVDADQQAMPSSSVPDNHKTLKIKVIDATYIFPNMIMEVNYDDTVANLKALIIHSFLKETTLNPVRIRLTFNSNSFCASTSPQGRQSHGHRRIREDEQLKHYFGSERSCRLEHEDDVKVHVKVEILPSLM
jgi:hypothetical protein